MAPGTPNFILLSLTLLYTSPPIFSQIGPKLPKLALGVVFAGFISRNIEAAHTFSLRLCRV